MRVHGTHSRRSKHPLYHEHLPSIPPPSLVQATLRCTTRANMMQRRWSTCSLISLAW